MLVSRTRCIKLILKATHCTKTNLTKLTTELSSNKNSRATILAGEAWVEDKASTERKITTDLFSMEKEIK